MHFDDSLESIADSDLEDGESQKMLISPLYAQKASEKPDAMVVQERARVREVQESLRSQARSESQTSLRKPIALFSSEQGNFMRSFCVKDHLLNQGRSGLAKQELHDRVPQYKCAIELQRQTEEQRLALQDEQYGYVESRREQVRLQGELAMKEKVLRNTQIRNMHEMGDIKKTPVQKLREIDETIQQLTSQLQQIPIDTWNQSGLQENVFGNQFSTCDSPRDHPQRIPSDDVERNREAAPLDLQPKVKTSLTSEDGQNYSTDSNADELRQDR